VTFYVTNVNFEVKIVNFQDTVVNYLWKINCSDVLTV